MQTSSNYDWTADPRVPALLARVARTGTTQERWKDFSDSSRGMKEYFCHGGDSVAALKAVHNEYAKSTCAAMMEGDDSAWRVHIAMPSVEDVIRRMNGEWVDYRFCGREGYLTHDEYLAKLDAVVATAVSERAAA